MNFGAFSIRLMTAADVPPAMVLKAEAGWNQAEADWLRFLDMQPDGCFVAELNGEPVGTAVTCVFGDVAWVAMVLVAKRVRGVGIGTALVYFMTDFAGASPTEGTVTATARSFIVEPGFAWGRDGSAELGLSLTRGF